MLPGSRMFSLCASPIKSAWKLAPVLAVSGLLLAGRVEARGQVTAPSPYDFGAVPANSIVSHTFTFNFTGAATIGSVSVVTQGVPLKDFQPQANDTSTSLCAAGSYSSGNSCTVDVTFSPLAQGRRIGEIRLLDGSGNRLARAYISGWGQGAVLVSGTQTIGTIAGIDNSAGYNYDPVSNTLATSNNLNSPLGVVADLDGNIYVADGVNEIIRKITPSGTISTVAGVQGQTPTGCQALVNAPALTTPAFSIPGGSMAIDAGGNLLVGDYQLGCLYRINLQAETITTILGQGGPEDDPVSGVPGWASNIELQRVAGVGVDGKGNIYIGTDGYLLKIDPTTYVTAVAGTGIAGAYLGEGGPALSATINLPFTIIFDASGQLIFTDFFNVRALRIDASGNIHTVLGGGTTSTQGLPDSGTSSNILATNVDTGYLWGVAIDGPGNLFATSSQYGQIIEVDPNGYAYLFSGTSTGTPFFNTDDSGDGGAPGAAKLSAPSGLWITPGGDMLVADEFGHDVRRIGYTPLSQTSLNFAATDIGHKSSDSPQSATLTNIGDVPLTFSTPATGTNPTISPSFSVDATSTCQQPSAAPSQVLALDASCAYAVDFIPVTSGPINGSLTISGNVFGGSASIALSGTGIKAVDTLVVVAPSTAIAGTPITVIVTAYLNGSVSTTFTGPLTITSTDGKAILPPSVNLTAGVGSFSATLETTGIQSITATDPSGVSGISNNILVSAGAPFQILPVSGTGQSTPIGTAFPAPLKVEVLDQYGNPVPGAAVTFSGPSSGASATFSPTTCSTTAAGYCSVVATANGIASSTAYNVSASASGVASPPVFSLTNLKAATTLSVTPSATSLVYGQQVTVSAAISPASAGGSAPTGSITFYDGAANALSPNATVSGAAASYTVPVPTVGTHNYFGKYLGDANFVASAQTAATSAVVVSKAPVTITGPSNPILTSYGSSTTVPLSLAGPYSGPGIAAPAGPLKYQLLLSGNIAANGTVTVSAGSAVVPVPNTLSAGTYTVMAVYTPGDANYAAGTGYAAVATVQVGQIAPSLSWSTPAAITYGTALGAAQLNATATGLGGAFLPGTFTYTPAAGTIPNAGSVTLSVQFVPIDSTDYTSATKQVTLTVNKATVTISGPSSPILTSYGSSTTVPLSLAGPYSGPGIAAPTGSLNYRLVLSGNIAASGTVTVSAGSAVVPVPNTLTAGSYTVMAVYTPGDAHYAAGTGYAAVATVQVDQIAPALSWATPAAITYGTALGAAQLNATATGLGGTSLPGTFTYTPAAGTIPNAGSVTLSVQFVPTDTTDYTSATKQVILTVNQATPALAWATPSAISYGTALGTAQLNATATGVGGASLPGTFIYTPAAGTIPKAGSVTLNVQFAPTDNTDYTSATKQVILTVNQATPTLAWATPSAISYGTALGGAQLNATATGVSGTSLPGTFTYTPAAGTIPNAGSVTLNVQFVPTDSTDYISATKQVILTVNRATPTLAWATPSAISYGTAVGAAQLNATATGVSGASLPGTFSYTPAAGNIPSAGSVTLTVQFSPSDSADYTSATKQVTLMVNKVSQAISFTPPATPIAYGSVTSIGLAATGGGSANPVTFSVTGPASLNGSALTITGAGSITVTANQAGNSNYSAASPVQQTIVVNKATVTVAGPAAQPVTFGYNQGGSIPVTVTGQYSGTGIAPPSGSLNYTILNASNTSVGSGALLIASGGASVPVASSLISGAYVSDVSYAGDANYLASSTPIAISLTIAQVQPSISWPAPSPITYGATLAGILNATATNGTSTVAGSYAYSAGTTAVTASTMLPAGTYTLSVSFTPTDTTIYKSASGSVTLIVNKAMPGVSVASSANPILLKNPTTFTATVASNVTTPSGSITFLDGTTPIGTGALVNGVASLTVSSLAAGPHTIVAAYSGDSNFLAVSSGSLSQHIDDFTIAAGGNTSFTIMPGSQAQYQFTLTPNGDATVPSDINLTLDGQPANATITFSPSGVNAGSGTTTFTVTVATASLTGAAHPPTLFGKSAGPLAFALLLLPFSRRLRRQARKLGRLGPMLLLLIASGAALLGVTGCGVKTGFFAQPQQTYTLTVTGASGALSHSASVTLTVE